MKKKTTISRILAFFILGAIVITAALIGVLCYTLYRNESINSSAARALDIAKSVAAGIDPVKFRQALDSGVKDNHWYDAKAFVDNVTADTGVAFLYILDSRYGSNVTYFLEGAILGDEEMDLLFEDSNEGGAYADEFFECVDKGIPTTTGIYDSDGYGIMVSGFAPIMNGQSAVGGVGVDISVDDVLASSRYFAIRVVIIAVVLCVVIYLITIKFLNKKIGRPISMLTKASRNMASGDMDIDISYSSNDEIGELANSFKEMVGSTMKQIAVLEALADHDLSVHIEARSEKDDMNISIMKMIENLNSMIHQIYSSTEQVSSGASQLRSGSKVLADGSMQQTAAVMELSSTIEEITQKTKESAGLSKRAADLAGTIRENAEQGSEHMERLLNAVNDITEASHSIEKVIKVIDDIAFQTNILALNAAVEAARAGQHGKGFAVVAEEVRSLAAKSAAAAKDTANIIKDSIVKADMGAGIAQDTSKSLSGIVSGINESGVIIEDIAKHTDEQAVAISHINSSISLVAQVIQQTSATAEETAASSDEMETQSNMLMELVSQFEINKEKAAGKALPPKRA